MIIVAVIQGDVVLSKCSLNLVLGFFRNSVGFAPINI